MGQDANGDTGEVAKEQAVGGETGGDTAVQRVRERVMGDRPDSDADKRSRGRVKSWATEEELADRERLRDLFRKRKMEAKLTQKEFGKLIGKTQPQISSIVNDDNTGRDMLKLDFPFPLVCKIASALDCAIGDFSPRRQSEIDEIAWHASPRALLEALGAKGASALQDPALQSEIDEIAGYASPRALLRALDSKKMNDLFGARRQSEIDEIARYASPRALRDALASAGEGGEGLPPEGGGGSA